MKFMPWVLCLVLFAALIICVFSKVSPVIDSGITTSYQQDEIERLQKRSRLIALLMVDLGGVTEEVAVKKLIKQQYASRILKEEEDILFVDDVGLRFVDGKIFEIVFYDEIDSEKLP